jgi:hypothetical protein
LSSASFKWLNLEKIHCYSLSCRISILSIVESKQNYSESSIQWLNRVRQLHQYYIILYNISYHIMLYYIVLSCIHSCLRSVFTSLLQIENQWLLLDQINPYHLRSLDSTEKYDINERESESG